MIERRYENIPRREVFRISGIIGIIQLRHPRAGRRKQNAAVVIHVKLCREPHLAEVAHIFCRFRALESTSEGWNQDCGEDGDDRHYDEHFDQRKSAMKKARGTLDHRFCGLGTHDIALPSRAKGKKEYRPASSPADEFVLWRNALTTQR